MTPIAERERVRKAERAKSIDLPGCYRFRPTGATMLAKAEELNGNQISTRSDVSEQNRKMQDGRSCPSIAD